MAANVRLGRVALLVCAACGVSDSGGDGGADGNLFADTADVLRDGSAGDGPLNDVLLNDAPPNDAPPNDGPLNEGPTQGDAALSDVVSDSDVPECPTWCFSEPLPGPLQEIAAVTLSDQIVVVGGFVNSATASAAVLTYSASRGWNELPPLPDARHHVGLAVHAGDLYVLGGMLGTGFSPIARSYVLRRGMGAWEEIAPMPLVRAAGYAAVVGDTLVVVGGQGEGRTSAERVEAAAPVLRYDPAGDEWTFGAALDSPREHVAGVAFEGRVWVFGGRTIGLEPTFARVDIYDVERDTWLPGSDMPRPRGGFAAAQQDGIAVVSGGEERDRALRSTDILDLRTGVWRAGPEMLSARHGHAMATLDAAVFAIGGADRPIFAPIPTVERLTP